jgi:hypothetical protein
MLDLNETDITNKGIQLLATWIYRTPMQGL